MASLVANYGTDSDSDADSEYSDHESDKLQPPEDTKESEPPDIPRNNEDSPVDSKEGAINFLEATEVSDGEDSESSNDEDTALNRLQKAKGKEKLFNPLSDTKKLPNPIASVKKSATMDSVFSNQYYKAEVAKNSILEKHVKMTSVVPQNKIGGKKACWNFRKLGRCNKGSKCAYAHDNDIVLPKTENKDEDEIAVHSNQQHAQNFNHYQGACDINKDLQDDDAYGSKKKGKKHKVGMSNSLVPPKRAMKMLDAQREKERPWTTQDG